MVCVQGHSKGITKRNTISKLTKSKYSNLTANPSLLIEWIKNSIKIKIVAINKDESTAEIEIIIVIYLLIALI